MSEFCPDESDLPDGWALSPLADVVDINPPKPKPDALPAAAPVTFLPMAAVSEEGTVTDPQTRAFAEVRKGYTAFADGDVILAKITPCFENGKAALVGRLTNGLGFGSSEFHVLRSLGGLLPKFIFHYFHQPAFRQDAAESMSGTAGQARVTTDYMRGLSIPHPPLAEQRRIVEKVEALLAQVNAARARLAKVPAILKRFRKSVLAAACAGRLTETWRESAVPDANTGDATPPGWRSVTIGQVAESLDNLRRPINKDERARRAGAIPYYGANGRVGWIDDWIFDETLVLVVEDETFIGRELPFSYVIQGKSWVNNHAHVLRPIDGMTADYLSICLAFYDFIPLTSGTTGRRKLTKGTLMAAPLTVAPLEEQHEIVRHVDALFKLADAIEARVATATARADKITQAILAKAFRGELVPTEAELARQEGRDYESASALLARIRTAREGDASKPSRGRAGHGASGRVSSKKTGARR